MSSPSAADAVAEIDVGGAREPTATTSLGRGRGSGRGRGRGSWSGSGSGGGRGRGSGELSPLEQLDRWAAVTLYHQPAPEPAEPAAPLGDGKGRGRQPAERAEGGDGGQPPKRSLSPGVPLGVPHELSNLATSPTVSVASGLAWARHPSPSPGGARAAGHGSGSVATTPSPGLYAPALVATPAAGAEPSLDSSNNTSLNTSWVDTLLEKEARVEGGSAANQDEDEDEDEGGSVVEGRDEGNEEAGSSDSTSERLDEVAVFPVVATMDTVEPETARLPSAHAAPAHDDPSPNAGAVATELTAKLVAEAIAVAELSAVDAVGAASAEETPDLVEEPSVLQPTIDDVVEQSAGDVVEPTAQDAPAQPAAEHVPEVVDVPASEPVADTDVPDTVEELVPAAPLTVVEATDADVTDAHRAATPAAIEEPNDEQEHQPDIVELPGGTPDAEAQPTTAVTDAPSAAPVVDEQEDQPDIVELPAGTPDAEAQPATPVDFLPPTTPPRAVSPSSAPHVRNNFQSPEPASWRDDAARSRSPTSHEPAALAADELPTPKDSAGYDTPGTPSSVIGLDLTDHASEDEDDDDDEALENGATETEQKHAVPGDVDGDAAPLVSILRDTAGVADAHPSTPPASLPASLPAIQESHAASADEQELAALSMVVHVDRDVGGDDADVEALENAESEIFADLTLSAEELARTLGVADPASSAGPVLNNTSWDDEVAGGDTADAVPEPLAAAASDPSAHGHAAAAAQVVGDLRESATAALHNALTVKDKLQELRKTRDQLKERLHRSQRTAAELKAQVNEYRSELGRAEARARQLEADLAHAVREVRELRKDTDGDHSEVVGLGVGIASVDDAAHKLFGLTAKDRAELEQQMRALQDELDSARAECNRLREAEARAADAASALARLQDDHAAMKTARDDVAQSLATLQAANAEAEAAKDALAREHADLKAAHTALERQRAEDAARIADTDAARRRVVDELAAARAELAAATSSSAQAASDAARLAAVQGELDATRVLLDEEKKVVELRNAHIAHLEARLREEQALHADTRDALQKEKEARAHDAAHAKGNDTKLAALAAELAGAAAKHSESVVAVKELDAKVAALTAQLRAEEAQHAQFKAALRDEQEARARETARHETAVQAATADTATLKGKVSELERKLVDADRRAETAARTAAEAAKAHADALAALVRLLMFFFCALAADGAWAWLSTERAADDGEQGPGGQHRRGEAAEERRGQAQGRGRARERPRHPAVGTGTGTGTGMRARTRIKAGNGAGEGLGREGAEWS